MSRNSLLYWFPFVERSGVSHPRTEIVRVEPGPDRWVLLDMALAPVSFHPPAPGGHVCPKAEQLR